MPLSQAVLGPGRPRKKPLKLPFCAVLLTPSGDDVKGRETYRHSQESESPEAYRLDPQEDPRPVISLC